MNKTIAATKAFVEAVDPEVTDKADWGIATPYLALQTAKAGAKNLIVAAENVHFKDSGAYTGEVSVEMLQSIGVHYCVIGHSERREYNGETNAMLAAKVNLCLETGITPIFCCGEPLEIREAGTQNEFVAAQLKESLFHLSADQIQGLIIAYEPIWAIGTGKTATTEQAQEVCAGIRACIGEIYDDATAQAIRIQYGGSVNPATAPDLFVQNDIDGGLVGGASLKADFGKIVNYK